MLVKKYKPKTIKEIVGQKKATREFIKWTNTWKKGKKALLLHGSPGTGKTALVHAYAKEKNLDFIEMNASDFRTAEQIKQYLGSSSKQKSLFKKGKIFLIDEIDGLAGRSDMGGVQEIINLIKESYYPIVLTANDAWDPKLRSLRSYCKMVQFNKVNYFTVLKTLESIAKKEKVQVDQNVLVKIAKSSKGDLRSAINDFETITKGKKKIKYENLESLGFREKEINIFEVLKLIFKSNQIKNSIDSVRKTDKKPDEILLWLEENITNEYKQPEEIAKAFDMLSRADVFWGRIQKKQNWKYMKYMIDLMCGGVSVSKNQSYRTFTRYQYPGVIRKLGKSKSNRKKQKEKLSEYAKNLHCSVEKVKKYYLPFFGL